MLTTLLLLLVPTTALGLVLGMARLEDSLLRPPSRHRGDVTPATEGLLP
ncbi:hypothetical protein [Aquipuribacter sp. MA13-6]